MGRKPGTPSVFKGKTHTAETKARISAAKKGQPSPNKGKTFSPEWRENLRIAHLGYVPTQKQLDALAKGREISFPIRHNGKDSIPGYRSWKKNENARRKKSNGGSHTFGEWETVKAQYDWTCPSCGKREPEIRLTQDHIIPLSRGGSDNIENIQPLCMPCNLKKMTKIIKFSTPSEVTMGS